MKFIKESVIKAAPECVFAFHELPDALERLIPPWEKARVIQKADISKVGSRAIIETSVLGPFKVKWIAEHTVFEPPHFFEDVQISGPFRSWCHRHIVEPHPGGAILRDEVEYELPIPFFGPLAAPFSVTPRLRKMFDHRHRVTREWCERETTQ
ncbi:MAG: SRPBCC family protein [Acidobacteriota bacterium]